MKNSSEQKSHLNWKNQNWTGFVDSGRSFNSSHHHKLTTSRQFFGCDNVWSIYQILCPLFTFFKPQMDLVKSWSSLRCDITPDGLVNVSSISNYHNIVNYKKFNTMTWLTNTTRSLFHHTMWTSPLPGKPHNLTQGNNDLTTHFKPTQITEISQLCAILGWFLWCTQKPFVCWHDVGIRPRNMGLWHYFRSNCLHFYSKCYSSDVFYGLYDWSGWWLYTERGNYDVFYLT